MASEQKLLAFDQRFLDRHAGSIISDHSVALVELVANAWDAYATKVDIIWPTDDGARNFSIKDNGRGMTAAQFEQRWGVFDYDRVTAEGEYVFPPAELKQMAPRRVYGRNGRGRHGGFAFSNPYEVIIEAAGEKVTYRVSRGGQRPFDWEVIHREPGTGHGVEVRSVRPTRLRLSAADVRKVLGTRFLTDPNFKVSLDGQPVTFDDIPHDFLLESFVDIPDIGRASILMIDSQRADRTARQHGIAWHVNNRLVAIADGAGPTTNAYLMGGRAKPSASPSLFLPTSWQTPTQSCQTGLASSLQTKSGRRPR